MSIAIDRFEDACKSKMPCRFCGGSGINDWDKQKTITVYGRDLKNISEIISYAYQHGYSDE